MGFLGRTRILGNPRYIEALFDLFGKPLDAATISRQDDGTGGRRHAAEAQRREKTKRINFARKKIGNVQSTASSKARPTFLEFYEPIFIRIKAFYS
jgi:hypothetical protein